MALIANFVTVRPEMAQTRTYEDFYKFVGASPARFGVVASMYKNNTASFLTEGLGNITYNKATPSKFQKINQMLFEWEIETNFIKRVPFSAKPTEDGAGGSEITMFFPERYYERYDTFQIVDSKQQCIVVHAPLRKADNYWEYQVRLIDTVGGVLDTSACEVGMETRFLTNIQPEFSEEGYTKYQSNVEKHRNWISEHRADISWSSRYATMEDTFIKVASDKTNKSAIFKMPKMKQLLLDSFMNIRNNGLLLGKSTMDANGKATINDPYTNRPLISGDGAIPQINRFAGYSAYPVGKPIVSLFNKMIQTMSQRAQEPQGNTFTFVVNDILHAQSQVTLADYLSKFKIEDATLYSKKENGKIIIGNEYSGYSFLGNQIIFKVDRQLSIEYPDRGFGVMIDLTSDKTSSQAAIELFTIEGSEMVHNTLNGVGGLDGKSSGPVASSVAGSKEIITGYAGIGVFAPYRSYIFIENK